MYYVFRETCQTNNRVYEINGSFPFFKRKHEYDIEHASKINARFALCINHFEENKMHDKTAK